MKNASHIFTRIRMGLDVRIWITFILIIFISGSILAFKMANQVDCTPFEILTKGVSSGKNNIFYAGETIKFSTLIRADSKVVWDFADGTPPESGGTTVQHNFMHNGSYNVTAAVNGRCVQSLTVIIMESFTPSKNNIPVAVDIIKGSDTPYAGETVEYFCTTKANSYEWSILNSQIYPTITTATAKYKFLAPGSQTLVLVINGDKNNVYQKNIQILPPKISKSKDENDRASGGEQFVPVTVPVPVSMPPNISSFVPVSGAAGTTVIITGTNFTNVTGVLFGGTSAASFKVLSPTTISSVVGSGSSGIVSVTAQSGTGTLSTFTFISPVPVAVPVKPKILIVADEEFKAMFNEVCNGRKEASGFNPYLCDGEKTKVLANNEWKSLADFCELLKDKKRRLIGHKTYKINSVKTTRDPNKQNCVTFLTVNYE